MARKRTASAPELPPDMGAAEVLAALKASPEVRAVVASQAAVLVTDRAALIARLAELNTPPPQDAPATAVEAAHARVRAAEKELLAARQALGGTLGSRLVQSQLVQAERDQIQFELAKTAPAVEAFVREMRDLHEDVRTDKSGLSYPLAIDIHPVTGRKIVTDNGNEAHYENIAAYLKKIREAIAEAEALAIEIADPAEIENRLAELRAALPKAAGVPAGVPIIQEIAS